MNKFPGTHLGMKLRYQKALRIHEQEQKKPIWKDKSNHVWYNRIVRRVQRMQVKQIAQLNDILEYEISQPNELVNDWDICDWKFDYRHPFWKQFHTPAELKRFCCK